jgi:hypothetical protein
MLPLICVAVLVVVVPDLPGAWRGYRGEGIRGTLTVTSQECGKGGCDYHGKFVSADGVRRLPHVLLQGGMHDVGDRVSTVLSKRDDEVFIAGDESTLAIGGFAAFAAALCLLGWTAWMTAKLRSRGRLRRRRQAAAPTAAVGG